MCMKNINANFFVSRNVQTFENGIQSYGGVFNGIVPEKDEHGNVFVNDINIVLRCIIMFNKDEKNDIIEEDGSINLDKEYEFMTRLTFVRSGLSVILDRFQLQLNKEKLTNWCKAFYEFNRIVKVPHLVLPEGQGDYAIKLFVREKSNDPNAPWVTQTLSSLSVRDNVEI